MGFWPFKKRVDGLRESGLMENFTDWHSHILPGVDDGVPDMEKSLEVLAAYERMGVSHVWLTPHIMEDYPNTTDDLRKRFAELCLEYDGHIKLDLAAENMLDSLFEERLAAGDLLPIGEERNHLLVETSYFSPPMNFDDLLDDIMSAGYYPILAHPERYRYMRENDYENLKKRGIIFQVNMMSLVGMYGETARKKAEWLLKKGMINLTGSDIHRLSATSRYLEKSPDNRDALENLLNVAQNPQVK
ncbi:MAG: capsular biosynthesis protein [Muribaculaceae bacterium]|nr:capsular biosynthesis protein [Muribaculaceae bacterium]